MEMALDFGGDSLKDFQLIGHRRHRVPRVPFHHTALIFLLDDRQAEVRYGAIKGRLANATLPSLPPARTIDRLIGRQLGL